MQNKVFSVKNIAKSFGSEKERNYIEVIRDISMDIDPRSSRFWAVSTARPEAPWSCMAKTSDGRFRGTL